MTLMNKILSALTAIGFAAASACAVAEEEPTDLMPQADTPQAESTPTPTSTDAPQSTGTPATTAAPAATPAPPPPLKVTHTELKDGTRVEINEDGEVTLTNPDGTKNPAPDGTYTLKNNTTFDVKDGEKRE